MRVPGVVILFGLVPAACWNGELALHKPCENDDHCGRGQSCIDKFCDGPPASTSGTAADTGPIDTETGGACEMPTPTQCDPSMRPDTRALEATELVRPDFARSVALVSGSFAGDDRTDLAVLSFDNYALFVLEHVDEALWPTAGSYLESPLTEFVDLAAADVDGDGSSEFVILSQVDGVEVVAWDGAAFTSQGAQTLAAQPDAFSLAVADVVGDDDRPDLVVSTSAAVQLMPNVGGMFDIASTSVVEGDFDEPWDTLVVGRGPDTRILVPESDDQSTDGVANQVVSMLAIANERLTDAPPFGTTFHNPWALAEGDFLGDDGLEIVVAERRLDGEPDDAVEPTTRPGRLRFFRRNGDEVVEVGEPIEIGVGPRVLAAADLDCDGKTDLVIGNSGPSGMDDGVPQVFFGSCDEAASVGNLMDVPQVGDAGVAAGSRMAVGDFDDDGLLEVAIPDFGDLRNDDDPGQRIVFVGVQGAP